MKRTVFADFRFIGDNGIGRFSQEVLKRLSVHRLLISGPANSPLCTLYTAHALRRLPSDSSLFFSPSYVPPLWSKVPYVFTVHDLNHIDRPENSNTLKRLFYELVLRRGCTRAAKVLTVSEFSRQRIVDWSGVSPDRVVNVGNGVDSSFNPNAAKYDAGRPYFLAVSNRKAHKNDFGVVEAFCRAALPAQTLLIFTGSETVELTRLIARFDAADRILFLGRLPEGKLPSIYAGAIALIFPSFYEGFGLPVIEAMACGTPVITSNTTSLPEVAGGAALLVDPTSPNDIAAAIERIASDKDLRDQLRLRGLARAAHFRWESVAERVACELNIPAAGIPVVPNKESNL